MSPYHAGKCHSRHRRTRLSHTRSLPNVANRSGSQPVVDAEDRPACRLAELLAHKKPAASGCADMANRSPRGSMERLGAGGVSTRGPADEGTSRRHFARTVAV